jgi:hypothetical protein
MPMNEKVKNILADLFMIDPELKKYEKEVEQAVVNMIEAKPDTKFDESFAAQLKAKLALHAGSMQSRAPFFGYGRYLTGAGILAALVVLMVLVNQRGPAQILPGVVTVPQVTELQENAFGHLAFDGSVQKGAASGESQSLGSDAARSSLPPTNAALPQALSMPAPNVPMGTGLSTDVGQGVGTAGQAGVSSGMIAPIYLPNYKLVYTGGEVKIETKAKVYKRVKNAELARRVADALRGIDIGLLNIDALGSFRVRSLELVESGDRPYSFGLNLEEGTAYINPDWQVWQGGTVPPLMGTNDTAISEGEAIQIADQFLDHYGIARANYGASRVENTMPIMYMKGESMGIPNAVNAAPMSDVPSSELMPRPGYYSPQVTVRYPMRINGLDVYDNGGTVAGLTVTVDEVAKRVVSVNDITLPNFDSSVYTLETDFSRIKRIAEQGGIYGYYGGEMGGKTIVLNLETPQRVLMRYFQYDAQGGSELIIPALLFEVIGAPQGQPNEYAYYPRAVVVPLVKEILDSINQIQPQPIPLEKPLPSEPATGTGTTEPNYPHAVYAAKKDLVTATHADINLIKVKSYAEIEWPDSCLGAGRPEEACAEVITPGYKILLTYKDKTYEYHTDVDGAALRQVTSAL